MSGLASVLQSCRTPSSGQPSAAPPAPPALSGVGGEGDEATAPAPARTVRMLSKAGTTEGLEGVRKNP